jgi:hypothetical protein
MLDNGYEASDSPFLAGMEERKDGIWLGGAAIWRNDIANVSAELLGDGSGNSKGSKFKLTVDHRFQAGNFDITPRLSVTRLDQKYVSYYYGVNAAEVRAGRPFYQGGSAVNMEAGLRVGYAHGAAAKRFHRPEHDQPGQQHQGQPAGGSFQPDGCARGLPLPFLGRSEVMQALLAPRTAPCSLHPPMGPSTLKDMKPCKPRIKQSGLPGRRP